MRKLLLVSFWCALLPNCLALQAAGVATPKVSAWPPTEASGAGADGPTLNLFVAEPESTHENGEHARQSWLPVLLLLGDLRCLQACCPRGTSRQ